MELPHLGRAANGLVTVSAGVASFPAEAGSNPGALFAAADAALYAAKQQGRNQVCVGTAMPLGMAAPASTS
jgi:two-component system chemotaxis family response regulator WspR